MVQSDLGELLRKLREHAWVIMHNPAEPPKPKGAPWKPQKSPQALRSPKNALNPKSPQTLHHKPNSDAALKKILKTNELVLGLNRLLGLHCSTESG